MVKKTVKTEKQKVAAGISPGVGAMENYVMEVPETPKPFPPLPVPPKRNKFILILIIIGGIILSVVLIIASLFLAIHRSNF